MTMEEKKDRDDKLLAAEYALGVLPHAERQAFSARLDHEAELRSEVEFWYEHYEPLSEAIDPATPPARLFRQIELQLFGEATKAQTTASNSTGLWSSLGFWRGLAFASLVGMIVMATLVFVPLRVPKSPVPTYIAELSGDADLVQLVALYEEGTGRLRVNRTKGEAPSDRDFELWLVEGGNDPVSLGVLPREPKGVLQIPEALRAKIPGSVLAISDEPAGGSPTGAATGPVLAVGNVSVI